MTQPKLQILGPYTPEHEGPFILKTPNIEVRCDVHAVVEETGFITVCGTSSPGLCAAEDIMNAREVPVVREFWVVDYGSGKTQTHNSLASAVMEKTESAHIIHVREVLPGEGE